jgi:hypothetical protein
MLKADEVHRDERQRAEGGEIQPHSSAGPSSRRFDHANAESRDRLSIVGHFYVGYTRGY